MNGVSLKELVRENINLAGMVDSAENDNKKISELLKTASQGSDVQQQTFELISAQLMRYSLLPELIFKLAVMKDDDGQYEEAIYLYRLLNMIKPDARSLNNMAVIYAGSNINEAKKILSHGLEQFPEDTTLRENLRLLNQ